MGFFDRILKRARAARLDGAETVPEAPEVAQATELVESPPEPAAEASRNDGGEFTDWLADMGAEPVSAEESALAIRDGTIAELRRNLAALRPLGEQLAEVEKARLALESRLAEVRLELARTVEEHHARLTDAEAEREKAERARERLEERFDKLRAKHKKRDRVATDRWHRIRALQQECRALTDELKSQLRGPADVARATPAAGAPNLALLFGPDSGPEPKASGGRNGPTPAENDTDPSSLRT